MSASGTAVASLAPEKTAAAKPFPRPAVIVIADASSGLFENHDWVFNAKDAGTKRKSSTAMFSPATARMRLEFVARDLYCHTSIFTVAADTGMATSAHRIHSTGM